MQVSEDTVEIDDDDQPSDEQLLLWAIEAAESMPPRRWLAKHGGWITSHMGHCKGNSKSRYNALVRGIAQATKPVPGPNAVLCPGVLWA